LGIFCPAEKAEDVICSDMVPPRACADTSAAKIRAVERSRRVSVRSFISGKYRRIKRGAEGRALEEDGA
jgi:hypothetical protein